MLTQFLIALIISFTILIFLIVALKVHPILALIVTSAFLGISFGYPVLKTMSLMNAGFGSTIGNVGIPIILGAILAIGLIDLKAADSIVGFFDKLFKGKRMELASALTAFIISIPVFGDITILLVAPIASRIAHIKKISMSTMVTFTGLGLLLTHALVPPTPGILATAMDLEADVGLVIVYGIIISLISFFITWLLLKSWAAKEFIKPLSKFSGEVSDGKELKEIPYTLAFLPILLPIIFIASSSIVNLYTADGGAINQVMNVLGDRVVALFSGVVMVFLLAFMFKQKVYDSAMKEDKEVNLNTPFIQLITNSWVARGAAVALLPLLVTGLSGSIANLIRENENVGVLAEIIASGPVPYILIPYALSAVLVATIGSATTAALTTAGIIMPMMPVLGLSPELTALSIGAGSLAITHLNNSGFWVNVLLFNLSTKQGLKYITFPAFVASVVAICLLSVAYMAGLV